MRTYISLSGGIVAMVAAVPAPNCTIDDYLDLSDAPTADVANCITVDHVDDWGECLTDRYIQPSCLDDLSEHIANAIPACTTPCENISSPACRICSGVIVIQQIVDLMPDAPYAMCGSDYDRGAIMNSSWTDVANAGNISSLYFGVSNLSETCTYCLSWWNEDALSERSCGPACTDPESLGCYNCLNVWWASPLGWCGVQTNNAGCEDADFNKLDAMNPANVKTCMESVVNGDGLVPCLIEAGSVNLTEDCATTLKGQFDYYDFVGCGVHCAIATSLECANCKGANMFYQTLAYDSILNGSCGTNEDRNLISEVDPEPVYTCGETTPYAGATCIGSAANVSTGCMHCLASRSHHVRVQCSPHCSDATSDDCLECVNIGLLGVAAFCNAHLSGSVGMSGLSLIGLAVFIQIMFLA